MDTTLNQNMDADKKNIIDLTQKNTDIISFFDNDTGFVFVHKKTEKLASAVYMITNLFSENEPIKWALRKKVSDLLSFIIDYKDIKESNFVEYTYNVKTRVLEIVSLLEISLRGGLVSNMNFSILKLEFFNFIEPLNSSRFIQKESKHESIPKTFFDIDESGLLLKYGQNKSVDSLEITQKMSVSSLKDTKALTSNDSFKRSNRQNIILSLLKKKKDLTIKDISQVIKDCSEKTIQRELISFISACVLKKTGERRWSRYSLV